MFNNVYLPSTNCGNAHHFLIRRDIVTIVYFQICPFFQAFAQCSDDGLLSDK